jgi:hypothetical protein
MAYFWMFNSDFLARRTRNFHMPHGRIQTSCGGPPTPPLPVCCSVVTSDFVPEYSYRRIKPTDHINLLLWSIVLGTVLQRTPHMLRHNSVSFMSYIAAPRFSCFSAIVCFIGFYKKNIYIFRIGVIFSGSTTLIAEVGC